MASFLFTKKLTDEIDSLVSCKHKSFCFIRAENAEDEAKQIASKGELGTTFIIARKDRWVKSISSQAS